MLYFGFVAAKVRFYNFMWERIFGFTRHVRKMYTTKDPPWYLSTEVTTNSAQLFSFIDVYDLNVTVKQ